ncbi:MAG: hypothetical protein HYX68_22965 [Planctomycetes bacterium]|jgi:hypothetical protein|nr:hypothetical protein [Planctomycetota bacterium]
MEAEAFERSLRAFTRRKPFQPFMVELVSGTRLLIEHPEALIFRTKVAVYVDKDNEITHFDNTGVSKITTDIDTTAAK